MAALVAEVGQCNEHAVDLVAVRFEEVGAAPGLRQRFDGPVVGGVFGRDDRRDAVPPEHVEDGFSALGAEVIREEAPVADDDA